MSHQPSSGPFCWLAAQLKIVKANAHDDSSEHEDHCTALCCARSGQRASVLELIGDSAQCARLRDLGLREGALVTVMRDGDPLIVRVEDARFGIGRAAAMNIRCELLD